MPTCRRADGPASLPLVLLLVLVLSLFTAACAAPQPGRPDPLMSAALLLLERETEALAVDGSRTRTDEAALDALARRAASLTAMARLRALAAAPEAEPRARASVAALSAYLAALARFRTADSMAPGRAREARASLAQVAMVEALRDASALAIGAHGTRLSGWVRP